jgi:hypothetical protein
VKKPGTETKTIGGRFSKREVSVFTNEHGEEFHYEKIDWSAVSLKIALPHYAKEMRQFLEDNNIPVSNLLADSPHGSGVRDYVLNVSGHEPDSQIGLAARILEVVLHIQGYEKIEGGSAQIPALAFRLNGFATLFNAYKIASNAGTTSAKNPRTNRNPLRPRIIKALKAQRQQNNQLKDAIISLCNSGHEQLVFEQKSDGGIIVQDDSGDCEERTYTKKAFAAMWTASGGKPAKNEGKTKHTPN